MRGPQPFVDIHCHLLPGIDDGAKSPEESLQMAKLAEADGTSTIIVTPHQLGAFGANTADVVRARTGELGQMLAEQGVSLEVLPGGDVRIEEDLVERLEAGEVMTLADRGKHVLLELPHELYFPLEPLLEQLSAIGVTGILSHPERNEGLLREPRLVPPLVKAGCLLQVTAGSLMGSFGPSCREFSEWAIREGLVHFIATDAHGPRSRRPLMARAYQRVCELTCEHDAVDLCCRNPAAVARGEGVRASRPARPPRAAKKPARAGKGWRFWKRAA